MPVVGDAHCTPCISQPSHRLIPCQHSVCYNHLLIGHDPEPRDIQHCARCHQIVATVIELADSSNASSTPSSVVDGNSIWSPDRRASDSNAIMAAPGAGWDNTGFADQTPTPGTRQRKSFTATPATNPSRNFQFGNPSAGNAMAATFTHSGPQGHYQGHTHPVQAQQGHIHNGPAHQNNLTLPPNRQTSFTSDFNSGMQNYMTHDPFLDRNTPMRSFQDFDNGYAFPGQGNIFRPSSPPVATTPDKNSKTYTQEHNTNASALAQLIKSGALEEGPGQQSGPQFQRPLTPLNARAQPFKMQQQPTPQKSAALIEDVPLPPFWAELAQGKRPTLEEAIAHNPFAEPSSRASAAQHGVIKISNIPYVTTKNEIVASVGRTARLVSQPPGSPFYAIHIIMERATAKTMDCFVELESAAEAATNVANFQRRVMSGRAPRIGDRHIEVEVSSQEALMAELFPRAKCVEWKGQQPAVYATDEPFNSGFRGFLTSEEMVMVAKHAETPQRSPFAQRCLNRTYESLISTLHKYPWHAPAHITIGERALLFSTTTALLRALLLALRRNAANNNSSSPVLLSRQLLQELVAAALSVPGFSVQQKTAVHEILSANGHADILVGVGGVRDAYLGVVGVWWPFEVVGPRPGVEGRVVEYYVALMREAAAGRALEEEGEDETADGHGLAQSPFAGLRVRYGKSDAGAVTLQEAAGAEWEVLYGLLARACRSGTALAAIGSP